MSTSTHYDVLIVGAGIAGSALAHALSTLPSPSKPLRIALLERSLAQPDRIVGELLQPGGVIALKKLGLGWTLDGIDAIPVKGYCVVEASIGRSVHIPYPGGHEGRSFHHGRFVMRLREAAMKAKGVDVIEATVSELVEEKGRVVGVRAAVKDSSSSSSSNGHANGDSPASGDSTEGVKKTFTAPLTIIADGCFSNFRTQVLGANLIKPSLKSNFIGAVLEDAKLPMPQHGTVALVKGYGPVLLYQIGERDTRMLVDLKAPLPGDLKGHILDNILPQLPTALHSSVRTAFNKDRLRRMPNTFLPPTDQSLNSKPGVLLLGDAWNMRHPLTGGGMTVALNDVVILRDLLGEVIREGKVGEWKKVKGVLKELFWKRKGLASTVNILSVALYDLFGADDQYLQVLRTGCFKYFEMGGECVNGPVSLLSGIAPSPLLLFNHFFSVAFYAIWVMFTHPREVRSLDSNGKEKVVMRRPRVDEYLWLSIKGVRVFYTACIVFGPLLWTEVRPSGPQAYLKLLLPLLVVGAGIGWALSQA